MTTRRQFIAGCAAIAATGPALATVMDDGAALNEAMAGDFDVRNLPRQLPPCVTYGVDRATHASCTVISGSTPHGFWRWVVTDEVLEDGDASELQEAIIEAAIRVMGGVDRRVELVAPAPWYDASRWRARDWIAVRRR